MKTTPKLPAFVAAAVFVVAAAAVQAHPGHSHADIPSLIRHPLAGPEHLLGSAALGIAVGALLVVSTRRTRLPELVRWTSALAVAAGVTLGLSV